ncbi:hypothetical protein LSH36_130g00019 [Paralvinella palmiformis]|uniref:Uncharacterized protein n=1 Tax=Paralvinella palmiformis TaxID=53620 RepID=A0AAD9JY05_9ANNE|nr:hypothetical protein LSH36_130g00019 [Paralvinella palmiformis]
MKTNLWIWCVGYVLVLCGHIVKGDVCISGDTYGYRDDQESSITEDNLDDSYLTGTVWYSSKYGRFDCCGLIKAFDVKMSYDSYIEFQVWSLPDPVTTTATFKAYYRTYIAANGGLQQTINLPFDKQIPIRDDDALGWINELFDSVKWSTEAGLVPPPDSDYLWEDFAKWGYYNYTYTFAYHPASFSTLDNQYTFANNGGQNRVFGVRNTATFEELPLSIAIYTTSHVIGDVVHTVLYSGGTYLEMTIYVKLETAISPDDGHLIWDDTTNQVKVGADLITASFGTPYDITVTIYDGCHVNQTSHLLVYVVDDRPQTPVCASGLQITIPSVSIWNQNQEETIATVSDAGCPASKVILPVAVQMPVKSDFVIGWCEANGKAGGFAYRESNYLPATNNYLWVDLSGGIPYNYDVTGNPFQFDDAGFYKLNSIRDYGFKVYIGQGKMPTITELPDNINIRVGDYVRDDAIASFKYSDLNLKDILTLTFTLSPPTGDFLVNDTGSGSADVLVNVTTLDGLQGNTYLLTVEVTDGCTTSKDNLTIYVYVETTTLETTTETETTKDPLSQPQLQTEKLTEVIYGS